MKIYLYSIIAAVILIFTSCEEVIEIDLNSANPHIVAEAYMEEDSVCSVILSYTTDYFDNEMPSYIEDAHVEVSDDMGNSEILTYQGNGEYRGNALIGIPEYDYSISFDVDEKNYTGSSSLLAAPVISKMSFEESIFQRPTEPGMPKITSYALSVLLDDTSPEDNFYSVRVNAVDSIPPSFYLVTNDMFKTDDNKVEIPLMMFAFFPGDTVNLTIYSIDEGAYNFYNEMNDAKGIGMSMGSQPYNPVSNLGRDVLGYFMARSKVDTTVIFTL